MKMKTIAFKNGRFFKSSLFKNGLFFIKLVVSLTIVNDDPSLTIVNDNPSLTIVNEENKPTILLSSISIVFIIE